MSVAEAKALTLWRAGQDTLTIARALGATEAWVCRKIAADQDRRQAERAAASRSINSTAMEAGSVRL